MSDQYHISVDETHPLTHCADLEAVMPPRGSNTVVSLLSPESFEGISDQELIAAGCEKGAI